MDENDMTNDAIATELNKLNARLDTIEDNMVRKSDVFQAVMTVHAFTFAIIFGVVVVLNAVVGFG